MTGSISFVSTLRVFGFGDVFVMFGFVVQGCLLSGEGEWGVKLSSEGPKGNKTDVLLLYGCIHWTLNVF